MVRNWVGQWRGIAVAAALVVAGMQQATAADIQSVTQNEPPVAASGPWQIRLRALGVITDDKGNVNGIPGSDLSYSDTVTPELDISYYFTTSPPNSFSAPPTPISTARGRSAGWARSARSGCSRRHSRCNTTLPISAPSSPMSAPA